MQRHDRRTFLKLLGSGAVAAALPASIERALALPANNRTRSIADVEHIVILTQENRAFDHYFGTMRGVRGFADPRAVTLPNGQSVWYQPNGAGYVLPFRPDVTNVGMTFLPDPPHGWNDSHAAWNDGRFDQWVPAKGVSAMTYHTRSDIPYHFALADAFTICDAYYCSLMGPTDPNRYHMWTGWCGNDGRGGGPVISNAELGYDWATYPERLQRAGISWRVYQDVGVGLDAAGFWGWTEDPYVGNYGDNSLLYFHQYQNAQPGNPLADRAKTGTNVLALDRDPAHLLDILRADVASGNLPQVSWVVAPEAFSEHPNFPADYGAWYISQVLDALTANPDLWSKTVLFVNYDEGGGFFDHLVPPAPPQADDLGASTVTTVNEIFAGDANFLAGPYGMGSRVPLFVVSPWSKGGWVNSQVFDHTSLIRFIEARYATHYPGLVEPNITPWRRAVAGDLTTAFNFANPNDALPELPSTLSYIPLDKVRHPDDEIVAPASQDLPAQEQGVRPARAVPYTLHAHASVQAADAALAVEFANDGRAAAVFHVRSAGSADAPRNYTLEPHQRYTDAWLTDGPYDVSVYGPNGFFRRFAGDLSSPAASIGVRLNYQESSVTIVMRLSNGSAQTALVHVLDKYTNARVDRTLRPHQSTVVTWPLTASSGWYDFVVTVGGYSSFRQQLAGHLETGADSMSDPAMGGML